MDVMEDDLDDRHPYVCLYVECIRARLLVSVRAMTFPFCYISSCTLVSSCLGGG